MVYIEMKTIYYLICLFFVVACNAQTSTHKSSKSPQTEMKFNVLTEAEQRVILNKAQNILVQVSLQIAKPTEPTFVNNAISHSILQLINLTVTVVGHRLMTR